MGVKDEKSLAGATPGVWNQTISAFLKDAMEYLMEQEDLFGNIVYTTKKWLSHRPKPAEQLALIKEPWVAAETLDDLYSMTKDCLKCPLGATRTHFVFGVGNPHADVMFIGEAPGFDEDMQGEPFVGRAGQLLNKILEAVHLRREDVYIANILKCRPPGNRDPLLSEMETCSPYLLKQIELIRPKIIIALGRIAAQALLHTNESLTELREKVYDFNGIKVLVTYHPAALLRNPGWKRPAWEDMKKFRKLYDQILESARAGGKSKPDETGPHLPDKHSMKS